jgi:hypothetical protein
VFHSHFDTERPPEARLKSRALFFGSRFGRQASHPAIAVCTISPKDVDKNVDKPCIVGYMPDTLAAGIGMRKI